MTPVSKIQTVNEMEEEQNGEENIPLKLETKGPTGCGSEVLGVVYWSFELNRSISCWHWFAVSKFSEEISGEAMHVSLATLVEIWFTWPLGSEVLDLGL